MESTPARGGGGGSETDGERGEGPQSAREEGSGGEGFVQSARPSRARTRRASTSKHKRTRRRERQRGHERGPEDARGEKTSTGGGRGRNPVAEENGGRRRRRTKNRARERSRLVASTVVRRRRRRRRRRGLFFGDRGVRLRERRCGGGARGGTRGGDGDGAVRLADDGRSRPGGG